MEAIVLPRFALYSPGPTPPNRRCIIATHLDELGRLFTLIQNKPKTAWWITAGKGGFRMATTIKTTSRRKSDQWRLAVEAGRVTIEPSGGGSNGPA